MNMKIEQASSRLWTLALDCENALENAGFQNVLETCPHIAIEHVTDRLEPAQLKFNMEDVIRVRRNEGFHKKNFFPIH